MIDEGKKNVCYVIVAKINVQNEKESSGIWWIVN